MTQSRPDTWMPLYIGDYLADTMHLDAEEHGAYMMLIMHYWKNGSPLRNDVNRLQQIARIKPSRVSKKIMSTVLQFFEEKDGYLHHTRIDEELLRAADNRDKQKKRTAAATAAKKKKNDNVTTNVTVNATSTPSPSPSLKEDKSSLEREGSLKNFDWKKIGEAAGVTGDALERCYKKFTTYHSEEPTKGWKKAWELWVLNERISDIPGEKEKVALSEGEKLIARVGSLHWKRKRGDWMPSDEKAFLNDYETRNGLVSWCNLDEWRRENPP